jgi:UDP-N-acetylmuramate: L-alanyl-gamma-D-glutamyl-meso-diaminopimelate ligase
MTPLTQIDTSKYKRIHLVGVGGTGMGSFAGMLKAAGYEVTGSDENLYPPMSDMLKTWGIAALTPYSASNLEKAKPDLVIIGNVIRQVNVEASAVRDQNIPHMSFPAALGEFFLKSRHSVVVAGTHGKTTTSSLMGHVLASAGRDPSFLVGGVTQNYSGNYRLGKGPHFVVEGDEYDTAYFDKGPKFLHYQAKTLILTSVEFDHADIYKDLEHYESSFRTVARQLNASSFVAVSAQWPNAVSIVKESLARVVTYSCKEDTADVFSQNLKLGDEGARFSVIHRGVNEGELLLPMGGTHNVENALGVYAAARNLGLSFDEIATAFKSFSGVKRRQEVRANINGILVIDDFAHHPTAVRETIFAIKNRYANRRVWAIFEPRSNTSRRNIHQQDYAQSFDNAQRVSIKIPERHDKIPVGEELDVPKLGHDLSSRGIPTFTNVDLAALTDEIVGQCKSGDVLLVMSNGSFGGLIDTLIKQISQKENRP